MKVHSSGRGHGVLERVRPRLAERALERTPVRNASQTCFSFASSDRLRRSARRSGSGVGCALGEEGIRAMTQPKSLHLRSWAPATAAEDAPASL